MKLKNIIFLFSIFFFSVINVKANSLESINIDIKIDKYGNMKVTEVWDMYTNKDTEIYKQEFNLGNITITDFTVRDEKKQYTYNDYWDIEDSFENKKYKNGINYTSNGLELCWGISEYGNKTYTLNYTKNNAVFNTEDAQVLYMRLINDLDFPPEKFNIVISGPNNFESTLDVWGYGYKGYAYVNNGKIYMSNEENTPLSKGDYAVILVKFPKNTFIVSDDNTYTEYSTFNDVLEIADENTFDYDYYEETTFDKIMSFISVILPFVITIITIFTFKNKLGNKYKFGPLGKKIDMKLVNNFRDIPCDKNIFKAYFLSQVYSLNNTETDFIGCVFLKWLDEGTIKIAKENKKTLFGSKETTVIEILEKTSFENPSEEKLYKIIVEASKNNLLEEKEFEKWAKRNYNEFYKWFEKAEEDGRNYYINENLVTKEKSKYLINDQLKDEAIKLAGLKKFLKEFSSIDKKEVIEVKLWKEYLMYAQIFGIANKVAKQFKKLYPEILTEMNNYNYDISDIIVLNRIYTSAVVSASSARSAAQSYSSGGGGFSSGGGGGGSFGGGGGGSR